MIDFFSQVTSAIPAISAEVSSATTSAANLDSSVIQLDTYIKIAVGALAGIGTLLGLPLILLNYRKTQAEIKKLDLESKAISGEVLEGSNSEKGEAGGIKILIDSSPHTNVQVLADPRFLAPLLLLIDFVFAWVILTLASHFLSFFSLGGLKQLVLAVLALILLLPIIKQSLRVRALLIPDKSNSEVQSSIKNLKVLIYLIWGIAIVVTIGFSLVILANPDNVTNLGWVMCSIAGILGFALLVAVPLTKNLVHRKVEEIYSSN